MVNLSDLSKFQIANNEIKYPMFRLNNLSFNSGQLIVVGSRPGIGRTTFLLYMLQTFLEQAKGNVLFVSNEHSESEVFKRFASQVSSIERSLIESVLEDVIITHEKMLTAPNLHIQLDRNYWENQRELILKAINDQQIKVLFIDVLQGLHSNKRHYNRDQELSYIVEDLKRITVDNQLLTIVSSTLTKAVDHRMGKRPRLSDLADTSSLENESDVVIMLHRPDYYGYTEDEDGNSIRGVTEIHVTKNRNGDTGETVCRFKRNVPQFIPI